MDANVDTRKDYKDDVKEKTAEDTIQDTPDDIEEQIKNNSESETDPGMIDDDPSDDIKYTHISTSTQYCFLLEIKSQTDSKTTIDRGYEESNPLPVREGVYQLALKLVGADIPCKYPDSLHFKLEDPQGCRPIFSNNALHDVAVVFKSDDSAEKEPRKELETVDMDTMDLGRHKLLPGKLNIRIIGNICLDLVDNDGVYEGETTSVFVDYWIQVLHKRTPGPRLVPDRLDLSKVE